MKDYRRLKTDENSRLSLCWNLNRKISKLNYRIHTMQLKICMDSYYVKEHVINLHLDVRDSLKFDNEKDGYSR